jgi:Fic family protein
MINNPIKNKIKELKIEYDVLRVGKESLITLIDEAELPESVYNSNAIENSTLTLKETEKILLDLELSRNISLKEVYEAKNLARVMEYIRNKSQEKDIEKELILLLHKMLITNIDEKIAGRFRQSGEYVRVGTHIALSPEKIEESISNILIEYKNNYSSYFLEKIAEFHLAFEAIHPFNDGNGRIGRIIINYQLARLGFPFIIVRNKGKEKYYKAFNDYNSTNNCKTMEKVIIDALLESFHKRITYLKGEKIMKLAEYAKIHKKTSSSLLNSAKRQNIPAFREKGIWKIGENFNIS